MPLRMEGRYQIGCRYFDIDEDCAVQICDVDSNAYVSYLEHGSREHWILLADLCLKIAEVVGYDQYDPDIEYFVAKPYKPDITRDGIRRIRTSIGFQYLVKESKRSVKANMHHHYAHVGWVKED